jgi:membrane AbrB-like protein
VSSMSGSLSDLAAAFAPKRFPYLRFLAALAAGWCGGYVFSILGMPLPWMLGSMTVLTIGAVLGLPFAAPSVIRPPMTAIIGVMLGSSFAPDVLMQMAAWLLTIAGLPVSGFVAGLVCVTYLHRDAGFDRTTAYFAGMPGGLIEMIELGEARGADFKAVALLHSARILLIVFTLPFLVQWLEGVSIGDRSGLGTSVFDEPAGNLLLLAVCAFVGAVVGKRLNLPGAYLVGPMLASALLHVTGATDFVPPREIVNGAQLVLGTVLGCRFVGTASATILRYLGIAVGSTAILVAVTLASAWAVAAISGYGIVPLILAYSPGGLAEMSLVALAIQTEVAFVAAHHVIRILMVMVSAGPIYALIDRTAIGRRETPPLNGSGD